MAVFKVQNRWASPDERPAVCQEGCRTGFKSWPDRYSLHSGSLNNRRKCAAFEMTTANSLTCSRLLDVGAAELKRHEHENKTAGNWGEQGLPFPFFPPRQLFACLLLSLLPHYLRAWNRLQTVRLSSLSGTTPVPALAYVRTL